MKLSQETHLGSDENAISTLESQDYLDKLPDAILLEIFNKVLDAKSLVRCLSVSKRFKALVPQVESVFLRLPRHRTVTATKPRKLFKTLVRFLQNIVAANKQKRDKSCRNNVLYYSPNEVLKGFTELKSLHVELPCCAKAEVGLAGKDSLLKWKAEFGTSLKSCVILAGNSVTKETGLKNDTKEKENDNQTALTDEDLKQRIFWVISTLIAASARHYLTKRVVSSFPGLKNVVVSDGDERGKVSTRGDDLTESRSAKSSDVAVESSLERSLVPHLGMKLWYVPKMVLHRCGRVMEGATLVVITPLDHAAVSNQSDDVDCELLGGQCGFDGDEEEMEIIDEAIKEILKIKKTLAMEMTSF